MAHRPQKKKNQAPLPEDEAAKTDTLDERNLVDAEKSAELSFEDRVRMYWESNQGFIIACIALALVIILGYQGLGVYQETTQRNLQSAYAAISNTAERSEFARQNSGTRLGGVAALEVADEYFSSGDHNAAAEYYSLAAAALEGNLLVGRARVGAAISVYETGDSARATALLDAIVNDNTLAQAARSEAVFHLAVNAYAEGDFESFQAHAQRLDGFFHNEIWVERLAEYRARVAQRTR